MFVTIFPTPYDTSELLLQPHISFFFPSKMQIPVLVWLSILILACLHTVSSQCLQTHKSLLLQFRSSLVFNHTLSTKLSTWNQSVDCCNWKGVKCDNSSGHIIGLDLSQEEISRGIDDSSSLFLIRSLQSLNLAYNPIYGNIPSRIGNLTRLTYLNLSSTSFTGQVPLQISHLANLVILDISMPQYLSTGLFPLYIRNPKLGVILKNLSNVRELKLDGIAISAKGNEWGKAISSSLPHLQALSMAYCNLTGGIHHSFSKLQSLSSISFDDNNLSAPVPEFVAGFRNLTTLSLMVCGLTGTFPQSILEIPTLTNLLLALNDKLKGTLPQSISNRLVTLDLSFSNFNGTIPLSMGSLDHLEYVDLGGNNFSGPIPSLSSAKNLYFLQLSQNSFIGSIPILPSALQFLDLSENNLEGPMPSSIFQLKSLEVLSLIGNRLNGTIKLHDILNRFENLSHLYLSDNLWSIDINGTSADSSFPLLTGLHLASTNLHVVPEFLKKQPYLVFLDLSNNQIQGEIPSWIWKDDLYEFNLSCNSFTHLEKPLPPVPNLSIIDLHSNKLTGQFPTIPTQRGLEFLDLSNNSFTSINPNIGNSLAPLLSLSLSSNNIHGRIPASLCNAKTLKILNLEKNHLSGTIPHCLMEIETLIVLNLRGNNLHGAIPDKFGKNCTLETLNLNANFFHGKIPRSIANCQELKVLDLGNNILNDTFPCHLKSLSNLQVAILRSNKLHGSVLCSKRKYWPLLQIIDLSSNHFNGPLSVFSFGNWKMMMAIQPNPSYLVHDNATNPMEYYQDQVSLTFKGFEFELQKILKIFTSIDLSNNTFHGEMPKEIGNLIALKVLNLSHNSLSGKIPPSIGNLSQLESLDLSSNTLSGNIPQQLANLNFLEFLNISYNRLWGKIPKGTQLQLFDASSYEGNLGLYGPPLTQYPGVTKSPTVSDYIRYDSYMEWMLQGAEVGLPVGIAVFIGPILYLKKWREWYNFQVDKIVVKFSHWQNRKRIERRRRRANRTQS